MSHHPDLPQEQAHLDEAYARLDALRALARRRLERAMAQGASGTHQNRSERDSYVSLYTDRIETLDSVEARLLFGRIDTLAGPTWIGRIGLSDVDQHVLQIDWRAPAAAPFYQATAASPQDLTRRRHVTTEAREVVSLSDEVFDDEHAGSASVPDGSDSALLSALRAVRTGRMGDIVATIQGEQDRIIRADAKGALVVQGGPGTGKTAVALHRAAYLLYTHRDRYERSGVLVVGPTSVFLRYVEEVLPSLGETGVVLTSVAELVPGVVATTHDAGEVAAVKGRRDMAEVVARGVAARRRVPAAGVRLVLDDATVHLSAAIIRRAGSDALRDHETHNAARAAFLTHLLNQAASRLARRRGFDAGDALVREDLLAELRETPSVRRDLNLLWMPLTSQRVLRELLARPHELAVAANGILTPAEQALLVRGSAEPFTVEDVPLLDEIASLLGDDASAERIDAARRAAEDERAASYAARVLEASTNEDDDGLGTYTAMVSGTQLADRFAETGPARTLAERAGADREWAYAHVVVDEAQELSALAWRALARRCPSRSMTVVGDLAQTSSAAGAHRWADALDDVSRGVWRVEELTINYRTPTRIAALAERVLTAMDRGLTAPRAVREGEHDPVDHVVTDLVPGVIDAVTPMTALPGRTVVIAVASRTVELERALRTAGVDVALGQRGLDAAVAVMEPVEVKGLEFDNVVLVEPSEVAEGPTGLADLYVALTRATSRLELVRIGPLPPALVTEDDPGQP
jgi:DNA helicase IV